MSWQTWLVIVIAAVVILTDAFLRPWLHTRDPGMKDIALLPDAEPAPQPNGSSSQAGGIPPDATGHQSHTTHERGTNP